MKVHGNTGKHHSEESKKKMSLALKGHIPWNKGKKLPSHTTSEETRRKIGLANKGRKHTLETRNKMSKAKKGIMPKNISGLRMGLKGKDCPLWKGGISTYERKLWLNNQRRVRKIGNGGSHTQGEWETLKAQYNWTCLVCKMKEPFIVLSKDHIIPLSKGGSDNIENIQPLCRSCNSKKHTKIINYKQ